MTSANQNLTLTIRPMRERDIPALIALTEELARQEPCDELLTAEQLTAQLRPSDGVRHFRLLAFTSNADGSDKLIAHGELEELTYGQLTWCMVQNLPAYRNKGVGSKLLAQLEDAAQVWGAGGIKASPDHRDHRSRSFFANRGYTFDHERWQLMLPAAVAVPAPQLPDGYAFRNFVREQDEDTLRQVIIAAFTGYADFFEGDVDEQLAATSSPNFNPENLFFTVNAEGEAIGYCLTFPSAADGWIGVMGVTPQYRRYGLGRAMLYRGIHYLRRFAPIVRIGTEGYNHKALALYEGTGFQRYKGTVHMVKMFSAL